MRPPIVKHYRGYILLAQNEEDLRGKIDSVNKGEVNGFYTVEDYINSREYDYKIYENKIEILEKQKEIAKAELLTNFCSSIHFYLIATEQDSIKKGVSEYLEQIKEGK